MNSQQIEYILTLAEQKSFSKAAQKLYVTQPSLSQYIINIEKQIGTTLFDRSSSPIKPTEAGKAYIETAMKIKSLEESLSNQLNDIADLQDGSLKIGTTSFRASCLLSKSIAEFSKLFRKIEVTVTEDSITNLLKMIKDGELDVLVGTGQFDTKLFHTEKLATENMYLAIDENNPLCKEFSDFVLTADDIKTGSMKFLTASAPNLSRTANENFIMTDHGEFSIHHTNEICDYAGFRPKKMLKVRTIETLFSFVNAGLGIGFVPDTLIRFGNFKKHPLYFRTESPFSQHSIYLVSKKNGYFTKSAKEYSLMLKKLVDKGTWRV